MSSLRRTRPRIARILRSRPPEIYSQNRFFAGNSKLLLLSQPIPRPQLSFLNASNNRGRPTPFTLLNSRLFTSETRRFLQEHWHMGWRWFLIWSAVTAVVLGEGLLIVHELLEREFPTPHEWRWINRARYHSAKAFEQQDATPMKMPFWEGVGKCWKSLIRHLEDPNSDGAGLKEQEDGGILIPGVGKAGYDITEKPEPWRRGYWEALMGAATTAEHLDGRVRDKTRDLVFPVEFMVGPSNPNPKPCPRYMKDPPKEEDCEPAFEPPETYYVKLLTTKGFTNKQRLSSAIAYGEWLDSKGQHEAAKEMFRWALDIAQSPLASPSDVIDPETAVIKPSAPIITENILSAANAFATHEAVAGNPSGALATFVSILRARRSCPVSNMPSLVRPSNRVDTSNQTDIGAFFTYCRSFMSIFSLVEYPPPPPSGDEPFERNPANDCEEAALMSYIGEVLFATSRKERDAGFNWTRDALLLANERAHDVQLDEKARRKCVDCIEVALSNWRNMVQRLEAEEAAADIEPPPKSWSSYFGFGETQDSKSRTLDAELEELQKWEEKVEREHLKQRMEDKSKPAWAFPESFRLLSFFIS